MTKKALPKVDLTFLSQFRFVPGKGNYADNEACIMSALYLATEIAAGRTTLGSAMCGDLEEIDCVTCVHPQVQALCIQLNDEFTDGKQRKEWALATLPRILGTNHGGGRMTQKVLKAMDEASMALRLLEAKKFAQNFLDTGEIHYLDYARDAMTDGVDIDDTMLEFLTRLEAALALLQPLPYPVPTSRPEGGV